MSARDPPVSEEIMSQQSQSQFVTRLGSLPLVQSGTAIASSLYSSAREYNGLTRRTFGLAESVTGSVVVPLAQKVVSPARPMLDRIDQVAARGLEVVEQKVPLVTKQPKELMSSAGGVVDGIRVAARDRVYSVSEAVLVSKPVQTYFDVLQFVLSKAEATVDVVLPGGEQSGTARSSTDENNVDGLEVAGGERLVAPADRGWELLGQFVHLVGTAKGRVQERTQRRVGEVLSLANETVSKARGVLHLPQGQQTEQVAT